MDSDVVETLAARTTDITLGRACELAARTPRRPSSFDRPIVRALGLLGTAMRVTMDEFCGAGVALGERRITRESRERHGSSKYNNQPWYRGRERGLAERTIDTSSRGGVM